MSDPHPSLDHARAVHADVLAAARRYRKARYDLANLLRRLADERLHLALGYASLGEYAEASLDLPRRAVRELVLIARSLADLPALDAALAGGDVAWSKAREIVRVATPATDGDWVAFAAAHNAREVEAAVVQAAIGERPEEPPPERGPARRRVTFMMEASDAEILHQALGLIRHQTGEAMDGVALAALAARFLSDAGKGEDGPTGEPYRVALAVCPTCGDCHSHEHDISEEIATEVACDAEVVDLRPGPDRGRVTRAIPARIRAAVLALAGWRCEVPGCTNCLWLHIHHPEGRGKGHVVERLVCLCSIHHRLTHQGCLAISFDAAGNLVIEREDGRRTVTVRRPRATHVGQGGEDSGADAPQPGGPAVALPLDCAPRGPTTALTAEAPIDPPPGAPAASAFAQVPRPQRCRPLDGADHVVACEAVERLDDGLRRRPPDGSSKQSAYRTSDRRERRRARRGTIPGFEP